MFESASAWHETKLFVEHLVAISHDTLHLIAGTALWLALCMLTRRSIADLRPIALVLAVAVLNEAVDLWVELWPSPGQQLGEGARDIFATIAIPLLFVIAARVRPSLFRLR